MAACPHCRSDLPAGSRACPRCGKPAATAAQPRPQVVLRVVRSDGGPEVAFVLRKEEAFAGAGAEIPLPDDPFVARRQARFFFNGSVPMVEDVGGGNGVFARIKTELRLRHGQELRCGRQRLVVETLPVPPPSAPRTWGSPELGYRFRLVQVLEGGRRGDVFPLKDGENRLGRDQGDIAFPGDSFVSGSHAAFFSKSESLTVRDVGSSNGTFMRIDGPFRLDRGDQLLVGRHLVKVDVP